MKVYGLFTGWACKKWVNPAIGNHLKLVDEVHVMIAAHNSIFEKLEDGTLEAAKEKWADNPRVVFHSPKPGNIKAVCDQTKCILLNQMLGDISPEPGDIILILDSDEFYDDAAIAEIKDKFDGYKWDAIAFKAKYFAVNMGWFVVQDDLQRMFRVREVKDWRKDKFHFKPTQRPVPRALDKQWLLAKNPLFHYSLLSPLEYKIIHWTTEKYPDPRKKDWIENIYGRWDPEDPELCTSLAKANKMAPGRFYVNRDMGENPRSPYLFRYIGPHPKEITEAGLHLVKDFRWAS